MIKDIDLGVLCGRNLTHRNGYIRYPVYVFVGDERHAHGVIIPDFPGCFSGADDWRDLPNMIQDAIETWCEGENVDLPEPTPIEKWLSDPDYCGGVWMMIDVDITKLAIRRSVK